MLAQEGEEDLLLREAMDLTLHAAAEDAKDAGFERSATSTAGQKERGTVAASSQMELERTITPWEEWTPHATSTPHPSPTSSTSLLSPVEAWGALATSTVHHEYPRSSGKNETT
ncbi:uncharacterized protein C8Q71DRAFT_860763 [Rhodofomes roseus]|uniref:Uncharacterized protein n=1 Tax=Rhodofomes roseus TaxID=34475 RepID=A0ABQ8K725_9APHY|nr:uncharacterized protein C8Q71DRAFT_860763 [Rhodofomes roseus]KAH9833004.1 hypothetical protein C8Q71DRAFT_860763 [Rhodofomes roseus]